MNNKQTPSKLRKSPLVEAIFELRFEPTQIGAGDLLPGLIFNALGAEYPKVETLPLASFPREIRDADPNLRHQATHRLVGSQCSISLGNRVTSISSGHTYPGWTAFKAAIEHALGALQDTKAVGSVERASFRYINLIHAPAGKQLSKLQGRFELRNAPLPEEGCLVRTELRRPRQTSIIQIHTNAIVTLPDSTTRSGLLVDVDTVQAIQANGFWNAQSEILDDCHARLKSDFFSLLTDETINEFDPEWS